MEATPLLFNVAELVELFRVKFTAPVGVRPLTAGSVAVSVTGWAVVAGLGGAESPTAAETLLELLTTRVPPEADAELKFVSPEYVPLIA